MEECKKKLLQLGEQKNNKDLQDYVKNIDTKDIKYLLNEYISHYEIRRIWSILLKSFDDTPDSHQKRFDICIYVLKLVEGNDVTQSTVKEILHQLRLKMPLFKSDHLVEICNFCTKQIQEGHVLRTSWEDILPETLNILAERNCVTYNNEQMSGVEFKSRIIDSLCFLNWSTNIVTPLASMFRDISLTKEEQLQIVNKLNTYVENLTSQELPSFTYQLLELSSKQNNRVIFIKLQHYFTNRIYKNLGKDIPSTSSSTDLEEITDGSEQDAMQAESTILYHIREMALIGNACIQEYINSSKIITKAPEYILHPFQLSVLLTISSVRIYEEQSLDIIRSSIVRVITEEAKKNEAAWFRNIISSSPKTSNIISAVLENCVRERPYIAQGLINLGFVLLSAGVMPGMKHIAKVQWKLAFFILLKLMKRKEEVSSTVIQNLCNKIIVGGKNVLHLTEYLNQMCKNLTLISLENQGLIIRLTEEVLLFPGAPSKFIVDAVTPLIKVSHRLRNSFMLSLRKSLFARELEVRKMAVSGYLKLMKCLRISNLSALSQSDSSISNTFSFFTQVTFESQASSRNQFSNEAICLEILGILRRCFMQPAEVREVLYDGLYDAVCMNQDLSLPALKMLTNNFNTYYVFEENDLPPLYFSKIVGKKDTEVILQEPLGHLIYVIGLILTTLKESHDISDPNIARTIKFMDSLCERMAKCELIHFDLDTGRNLLDDLPECQTDLLILKQSLSIYEALMGYLILSWTPESENIAQRINNLFQAYGRLVDFSKNLSKPKKADGRKKSKDDSKSKTATTGKTQIFKPIFTVIDFPTAFKILNILYEPTISTNNMPDSDILKVKCEFHRYVLNVILQLLQNLKSSKCIETIPTKPYFNYCTEIAMVLYEKIIKRLSYVIDFDRTTVVLGVECFYHILNLIVTYYKEKLIFFFHKIGSVSKDRELGDHLYPIIEIFQQFFEKEEDEFGSDSEIKKLPVLLVNIYTILVLNLPYHGPHAGQVLAWLKKFTDENIVSNKHVGSSLITLCLNLNIRCKEESSVYKNIAIKLCDVIGTINADNPECPAPLKIINEGTALTALISLINALKTMLNEAEWVIQRCKAEHTLITQVGLDRTERRRELLKSKEINLCCHLCRIVNICTYISNMAVPEGGNAEAIFKLLILLYSTLNNLTKYFVLISSNINPAFQNARFEAVLKLTGSSLSNAVYSFISHIGQPNVEEGTQQKKKSSNPSAMILREARSIPKLVFEMERFGINVIQLSTKTRIDLSKYVGLGAFRDFKIKVPILKEVLEEDSQNNDDNDDDETEENNMEVDEQEETESPPEKKSRK